MSVSRGKHHGFFRNCHAGTSDVPRAAYLPQPLYLSLNVCFIKYLSIFILRLLLFLQMPASKNQPSKISIHIHVLCS